MFFFVDVKRYIFLSQGGLYLHIIEIFEI
jgi:hypothetical protein